jgi:hypothetical protein
MRMLVAARTKLNIDRAFRDQFTVEQTVPSSAQWRYAVTKIFLDQTRAPFHTTLQNLHFF